MISFQGVLLGVGGLLIIGPRAAGAHEKHHGVALAAASGVLFGVCNVAVKALSGMVGDAGIMALVSPWTAVALVGSAAAFYASARSLQDGEAVEVIAITGTAASICCIAGGILVFGDPMPGTADRHRRPGRRLPAGDHRLGADARSARRDRRRPSRRRPPAPAAA